VVADNDVLYEPYKLVLRKELFLDNNGGAHFFQTASDVVSRFISDELYKLQTKSRVIAKYILYFSTERYEHQRHMIHFKCSHWTATIIREIVCVMCTEIRKETKFLFLQAV
jgi:hypothetical protein